MFITVRTYSNKVTVGNSPYLERLRVPADHTVACLCSNVPKFVEPENWPPNSPDLNPQIIQCEERCSRWYKISDTDQLKQVLIDSWAQRSQDTLNRAIDQLPKRLTMVIKAKGGDVEFRLD